MNALEKRVYEIERALRRLRVTSANPDWSMKPALRNRMPLAGTLDAETQQPRDPAAFSIAWQMTNYRNEVAWVTHEPEQVTLTQGGGSGEMAFAASPSSFVEQGSAVIDYADGPRMAYWSDDAMFLGNIDTTERIDDGDATDGLAAVHLHGHMLQWLEAPFQFVNFLRDGELGRLIGPAVMVQGSSVVMGAGDVFTLSQLRSGITVSLSNEDEDFRYRTSFEFRILDVTAYDSLSAIPSGVGLLFSPKARENWNPALVDGSKWEEWYA